MTSSESRPLYRPYSLSCTPGATPLPGDVTYTPTPLQPIPLQSFSEVKVNPTESRGEHVNEEGPRSRVNSVEYQAKMKSSLNQGLTFTLLLLCGVVLIGTSFQFGYNLGVLNQPVYLIRQFYNSTYTARYGSVSDRTLTLMWALTTTLYLPGGMIGAFIAGYIADSFGRKRAVVIGNIPGIFGAVISYTCVLVNIPELLMIGRFITGISCGIATQLAPMYLAEVAPYNLRGAFGTASQLFITLGILVGSVLGLGEIFGTRDMWQYLLLANVVPAGLCLLILPCLPDSPRFLLINLHQRARAEKALRFLRGTRNVTAELEEMELESHASCENDSNEITTNNNNKKELNSLPRIDKSDKSSRSSGYSMCRLLSTRELRLPLIIAIMLQIAQQLSGINAIIFYSKGIYLKAGLDPSVIPYSVVATNAVNVIMTFIAVPIMDRAGRRPMLIYPLIVMTFILGLIVCSIKLQTVVWWSCYISVACVLIYVICFSMGLGPIPMMIGAELFRQGPRPRALSLAGLTNWLFTAIVVFSFDPVQAVLHEYTFLIFLGCMIVFTIFFYFKVPETKNKTFEEIASHFRSGGGRKVKAADDIFVAEGAKAALSKCQSKAQSVANKGGKQKDFSAEEKMALVTSTPSCKVSAYVPYVPNPEIKIRSPDGFQYATLISSPGEGPLDKTRDPPGYYVAAGPPVDEYIEAVMVDDSGMYSIRL